MNYLFYSNYPYFEALHLGRFVRWLAKIESGLDAGLNPTQQLCHMAYHAGNVVFKEQLFDPGVSEEEFTRRQAAEAQCAGLSEEARDRELREFLAALNPADLIDSDDVWLKPVTDGDRVAKFVRRSRSALRPLVDLIVPGESLVEDAAARYVDSACTRQQFRGFYGLMTAWDFMRMQDEGKPPYSISFAPTFGESLEEVLREEGEPEPDMQALLDEWSRPRPYRLRPRDFRVARAGVWRARQAQVIPEVVAGDLVEQLDCWEE